jgi:hypothetical protein
MGHETSSQPVQPGLSPLSVFLSRYGDKILALVPLAFLIWVVVHYAVAVPFMDQWDMVPLLEKTYHGELTFHDLWAQHNEHRPVFPQLIMLLLARLTHWNIHYELAVNISLALGIFAVFAYQVKITGRRRGIARLPGTIPAISLIVFSVSQYENWLWGWQLQMFLNLLAVAGGIVLLANDTFRWWKFAAAALLGIVATYSFANGVLFWPIGLLLLLIVKTGAGKRRAATAGWILIGALTLGTYFHHYLKPENHSPINLVFKTPVEYVVFVFRYLGTICAQVLGGTVGDVSAEGDFAFIFGLAVTVATGWAGWTLLRKKIAGPGTLLPYFGLILYSVGSALVTGVGRLGFGTDQALASRYSTMVVPLWVSLVVLLILLRTVGDRAMKANPARKWHHKRPALLGYRPIAGGLLLAAISMLVLGSVCATVGAKALSQMQTSGRNSLLNVAANPASETDYQGLGAIYAWPAIVMERYPILVKHQLSLFKDVKASSISQ